MRAPPSPHGLTKHRGLKHAVECNCILPQFRGTEPPVFHRFVVFSMFDADDNVMGKYVTCNNCGAMHHVTEIGRSKVVSDENTAVARTIDDVALGIPDKITALLKQHDAPFATWEECEALFSEKSPKALIVLTRETIGSTVRGKALRVLGRDRFQIEQYETSVEF